MLIQSEELVPVSLNWEDEFRGQLATSHTIQESGVVFAIAVRWNHQKLATEFPARIQIIDTRQQSGNRDFRAEEDILDRRGVKACTEPVVQLGDGFFEHGIKKQSGRQRAVNFPGMRFGEFASLPQSFELLEAFGMRIEKLPHHSDTILDL